MSFGYVPAPLTENGVNDPLDSSLKIGQRVIAVARAPSAFGVQHAAPYGGVMPADLSKLRVLLPDEDEILIDPKWLAEKARILESAMQGWIDDWLPRICDVCLRGDEDEIRRLEHEFRARWARR